MKKLKRLLVLALCFGLLSAESSFAATPNANIITPIANSVVASSDLYVSVRVLNKKKITVSIFEEKEFVGTKVADGVEEEILRPINVKDFTSEMLELLSKEYEEKKTIEIADEQTKHIIRQVMVGEKASFTPKNSITLFTKTLNDQTPGLYMVQVDVLNDEGKVEETYRSFIALQEKVEEVKDEKTEKTEDVPVEAKTSLVQILTKLLKALVK